VQTAKSRKKLSVEEVVAVIRAGGEPDEELASIYEHGVTSAERAEAEAKVAAAKEKAEADAKARAEAEAEELARVKAENEALKAEAAAQKLTVVVTPSLRGALSHWA
jgi:membrane protein involved in colicin uptake